MKAIDGFNATIERAEHFLKLYEVLHDNRKRAVRSDWGDKFRALMRWSPSEKFERVDGTGSILILLSDAGVSRAQFNHDILSELLRGSIVTSVSALDRYLHDLVVERCWALLTRKEADIPSELAKIRIPVVETKRALQQLRNNADARPGNLVKKAVQEMLHKETFQSPDDVKRAAEMVGCTDFWTKVSVRMTGKPAKGDVVASLRGIAIRRNQIVHEADLVRKVRDARPSLRDISHADAKRSVMWMKDFVAAIEQIV